METFVNFIKEYGATIVAALSVIVGIIAALIKKRPKTYDDFWLSLNEVLNEVPLMVDFQERVYGAGHGDEKRTAVLVQASKQLSSYLGRELTKQEGQRCICAADVMLERVLDAPQKKLKKGVE